MLSDDKIKKMIKENGLKSSGDVNDMFRNMYSKVIETMLQEEMTDFIGYEKHQESSNKNSRNGSTDKTVRSDYGELDIKVPRDRKSEFEPKVVKKGSRDISVIDDVVLSLYAKGLSVRDIEDQIKEIYDVNISSSLVSNITNKILPEIDEWQNRPLKKVYPIVYLDAIHYKVRQDGKIINKAVHVVLGVDLEGYKEILGLWVSDGAESATFWLQVLNELKNRGVEDILIACSDNLKGFTKAIKSAFPKTEIQKCIIHQIRNSTKYVSYKDRKEFCKDLKKIYTATNEEQGAKKLKELEDKWGNKYKLAVDRWYENWDEISVFFKYPPVVRKIIYTTNSIESFNRSLRKVTKTKGSFPTNNGIMKLLYLVTMTKHKKWQKYRVRNWPEIISQFAVFFEDRLKEYLD